MSHYHLLGVDEHADDPTVRRAYQAALSRLPASPWGRLRAALGGVTRTRIERAFAVLGDPARRAAYDRQLALNLVLSQVPPGH